MEAKYTKGPWSIQIVHNKDCEIYGTVEEGPHASQVVPGLEYRPRRRLIATVHGLDDEGQANIKALSAVPELVEACKAILAHRLLDDLLDELAPDIKIKLQAALSKAGVND